MAKEAKKLRAIQGYQRRCEKRPGNVRWTGSFLHIVHIVLTCWFKIDRAVLQFYLLFVAVVLYCHEAAYVPLCNLSRLVEQYFIGKNPSNEKKRRVSETTRVENESEKEDHYIPKLTKNYTLCASKFTTYDKIFDYVVTKYCLPF